MALIALHPHPRPGSFGRFYFLIRQFLSGMGSGPYSYLTHKLRIYHYIKNLCRYCLQTRVIYERASTVNIYWWTLVQYHPTTRSYDCLYNITKRRFWNIHFCPIS